MTPVHDDTTIVYYVSPDGVVLHLSGGTSAGAQGFVLGYGPEGLGDVEAAAIFDKSARQVGEEYVDTNFDHGKIDLPIYIHGATVEEFHRRRDWFRELLTRGRQGWLCVYTTLGWRWIAVRRGSIKPAYGSDPAADKFAVFDVLLLADHPFARAADGVTPEWINKSGPFAKGNVVLYPGREVDGWPQFLFTGPGMLWITYSGVDGPVELRFPTLFVGEVLKIDTEYGMQRLRAIAPDGKKRNLWELVKWPMNPQPIPAGAVTTVNFSVTGGSSGTKLWGTVPRFQEGLL